MNEDTSLYKMDSDYLLHEKIPDHILIDMVDQFLEGSVQAICRGSQVCKYWNQAFCETQLWRSKLLSRFGSDPAYYHPQFRDRFDSVSTTDSDEELGHKEVYAATHVLERRFSGGAFISRERHYHPHPITCLAIRDSAVFLADSRGSVSTFDISSLPVEGNERLAPCVQFSSPVSSIVISDNEFVITGHLDGSIRGSDTLEIQVHDSRVTDLAIVDNFSLLSVSSRDACISLTDLSDSCVSQMRRLSNESAPTTVAALSPTTAIIGCRDNCCRIYDWRQPGGPASIVEMADWCLCVETSPLPSNPLMFRASDKGVHLFDSRHLSSPVETRHKSNRLISKFRSDFSLRLVSCGFDGELKISSLESQNGDVSIHTADDYILAADFDRTTLCCGGMNGKIEVFSFN